MTRTYGRIRTFIVGLLKIFRSFEVHADRLYTSRIPLFSRTGSLSAKEAFTAQVIWAIFELKLAIRASSVFSKHCVEML